MFSLCCLKQMTLSFVGHLTRIFLLFVLAGNAFTVNAGFDNQVERLGCEAEFPLRNRQPPFGPFHNAGSSSYFYAVILYGFTLHFGYALEAHAHFLVIKQEGECGPFWGKF